MFVFDIRIRVRIRVRVRVKGGRDEMRHTKVGFKVLVM